MMISAATSGYYFIVCLCSKAKGNKLARGEIVDVGWSGQVDERLEFGVDATRLN